MYKCFCDIFLWTSELCFSEVWRYVVKLKLWFSPNTILTATVNCEMLQFKVIPYIDFFVMKWILFISKRSGFSRLLLDDYFRVSYEENESTRQKRYLIQNMKYFWKEIRLPLKNTRIGFERNDVCIVVKKKNWNRLYSFGVEYKIVKNARFVPNTIQCSEMINRMILQPIIDFGSLSKQHK